MCDKMSYRSKSHARRVMRHLSTTLKVYYCQRCSAFHLSKERGKQEGQVWK